MPAAPETDAKAASEEAFAVVAEFAEVLIRLGTVLVLALTFALLCSRAASADSGTFHASDPSLDAIWQASVSTADDMLAPGGQTHDALGDYCPLPAGITVILDGDVRDRCSYIGDESVTDLTFDASDPHFDVQRDMLMLFAASQYGDGAIPSAPFGGGMILFDYCGYWVTVLHNYLLYSGDFDTARRLWPNLVKLMDVWYPEQTDPATGLLVNNHHTHYDYGFIRRKGDTVAYFNAQYVLVLRQAAEVAGWLSQSSEQQAWTARADRTAPTVAAAFWDPAAGAFSDTTIDRLTHPQDGNAFMVMSGAASAAQAKSALDYLDTHNHYVYGNSIADVATWDDNAWGFQANQRVYPFISFDELLARYAAGLDASALDLIRREWGYMTANGPQPARNWELIGPMGGPPTDHWPLWDAGWASGGAPALTEYVLGVRPTSPGYATFVVDPRPGDLAWASGSVVTARGTITVSWTKGAKGLSFTVTAPAGEKWANQPAPAHKPAAKPKPKPKPKPRPKPKAKR